MHVFAETCVGRYLLRFGDLEPPGRLSPASASPLLQPAQKIIAEIGKTHRDVARCFAPHSDSHLSSLSPLIGAGMLSVDRVLNCCPLSAVLRQCVQYDSMSARLFSPCSQVLVVDFDLLALLVRWGFARVCTHTVQTTDGLQHSTLQPKRQSLRPS